MKHLILLTFTLLPQTLVMASDTTIIFRDIPYGRVFEIAAAEKKMVFMYFHFDYQDTMDLIKRFENGQSK